MSVHGLRTLLRWSSQSVCEWKSVALAGSREYVSCQWRSHTTLTHADCVNMQIGDSAGRAACETTHGPSWSLQWTNYRPAHPRVKHTLPTLNESPVNTVHWTEGPAILWLVCFVIPAAFAGHTPIPLPPFTLHTHTHTHTHTQGDDTLWHKQQCREGKLRCSVGEVVSAYSSPLPVPVSPDIALCAGLGSEHQLTNEPCPL